MPNDGHASRKYIVNFLRDRDFYHVPLALKAHDQLECLITDIYFDRTSWWKRVLPRSLKQHCAPELEPSLTKGCLLAAAEQFVGRVLNFGAWDYMHSANRALAASTRRVWQKTPADLLLYSQYACEAFEAATGSDSRKVLFLYHPHHAFIDEILSKDAAKYPEVADCFARTSEVSAIWRHRVEDREIELADAAITASSFSKRSLEFAGFKGPVKVVPYAQPVAQSVGDVEEACSPLCRFLFVGQAVQRKGLHHLFRAWAAAKLSDAELTCVCATGDAEILNLAPPGVRVLPALSRQDLLQEFRKSDVFVMPSLIEGFGLVYLEALASGNLVIGTENTGLPDMRVPSSAAMCIQAGDIAQLTHALVQAAKRKRTGDIDRRAIAAHGAGRSVKEFGTELVGALAEIAKSRRLSPAPELSA